MGHGHGDCHCNTGPLDQALEHLLVRCLGIEQVLHVLLMLSEEEGLMLGLLEDGEGCDDVRQ